MAAFDLLDPRSLDSNTFVSSRDPFSKAFEDDFPFATLNEPKGGQQQYQPMDSINTKPGLQVNPLEMDARLLGQPPVHVHPQAVEALRSRMPLSPPGSATISPKQWPYDEQDGFNNSVFTNSEIASPGFNIFGQMTPPEDKGITATDSASAYPGVDEAAVVPSSSTVQNSAISQNSSDSQIKSKSKRNRKSTARNSKRTSTDSNNPNDVRRSKFLERNRVAASKCRQKKKEWTSDLENKARELQAENHNLQLWLDSLRDEFMYLKTQVAEHRACESREINEYLDDPKRDLLALNNPASRNLLESMRRHRIKQEPNEEEHQDDDVDQESDEDDDLRALLADPLKGASTG